MEKNNTINNIDRIYKTIKNFNIKQIRRLIWIISFFNMELDFFMQASDFQKWKKEIAETKNLLLNFKNSHLSYDFKFGIELNLLQAVLLTKYCKPSTIDTLCIIANDIKSNISIAKIMWNCNNYIHHQLKEIF